MLPPALTLVLTALCAAGASGGAGDDRLAALTVRVPAEFLSQALPPPPSQVELVTHYYGTVTVDHSAHLARKVHCAACHDPGPVHRIEFTPKVAHDRCRGCHAERLRGPTDCRGCHVLPPKEAAAQAPAAPPSPPARADGPPLIEAAAQVASSGRLDATGTSRVSPADVPGGAIQGVATPMVATPAVATPVVAAAGGGTLVAASPAPAPFEVGPTAEANWESGELTRSVDVGGAAGTGFGLSAQVRSRQGRFQMAQGVDRLGGSSKARTLLLVGFGAQLPLALPATVALVAEGVAGVDAVERPTVGLSPTLGARVGVEWRPSWAGRFPFQVYLTGLLDLFDGGLASPSCLYATIGFGTPLRRR